MQKKVYVITRHDAKHYPLQKLLRKYAGGTIMFADPGAKPDISRFVKREVVMVFVETDGDPLLHRFPSNFLRSLSSPEHAEAKNFTIPGELASFLDGVECGVMIIRHQVLNAPFPKLPEGLYKAVSSAHFRVSGNGAWTGPVSPRRSERKQEQRASRQERIHGGSEYVYCC